ncbi:MAG: MgtC/SapB family protein [Comamonadaceae bacterium]|nr:MAG: MgtC/SapB family protein [Comamonadaceae bacterium]
MGDAVASEFSDVTDVAQLVRIVLRLLLAGLLGFVLGFEREQHGKAAGVRTHMLVAIGSALFMLIPQQTGIEPADMSRVVQGLIAGIGFLCAGTILKQGKEEQQVQGLTTAAGLWTTAAIGMACGLGRETTAVLSALLAFFVMALVPRVVNLIEGVVGAPRRERDQDGRALASARDDEEGMRPPR